MITNNKKVELEETGAAFCEGVVRMLGIYLAVGIAVYYLVVAGYNSLGMGVDDSDTSAWNRSGLRIHTDAKTGIEYLSDGRGGLIVRQKREETK